MSIEESIWAAEFTRAHSAQLRGSPGQTEEKEKRFVRVAIRSADELVRLWKTHRPGGNKPQ